MENSLNMRIALREEGDKWCAYAATMDSMEDAQFLGAIHMDAVKNSTEVKDIFVALMKDTFNILCLINTGQEVEDWLEIRMAPEHERAGKA